MIIVSSAHITDCKETKDTQEPETEKYEKHWDNDEMVSCADKYLCML